MIWLQQTGRAYISIGYRVHLINIEIWNSLKIRIVTRTHLCFSPFSTLSLERGFVHYILVDSSRDFLTIFLYSIKKGFFSIQISCIEYPLTVVHNKNGLKFGIFQKNSLEFHVCMYACKDMCCCFFLVFMSYEK